MVSLEAKFLSEPYVSLVNTWFNKVHRRLLSIFCHLRKHLDTGRKVNSSTDLRKLDTLIQKLPVIMKDLMCIPLDDKAVLKSVAASYVVLAYSPADQRTSSADSKPSNIGVLTGAVPGLAHCAATCAYVVPNSPRGMRMHLGRMRYLGHFGQYGHLLCKCSHFRSSLKYRSSQGNINIHSKFSRSLSIFLNCGLKY